MARSTGREAVAWVVAGVLVLTGVVTVIIGLSSPVSFGWFAYQPLANAVFVPGGGVFVSRMTIVGFAVLTVGLIALAFIGGWRLARRPG